MNPPLPRLHPGLLSQSIEEEVLVYHSGLQTTFLLNRASAAVFQALVAELGREDLLFELQKLQLPTDPKEFLGDTLERFSEMGLLRDAPAGRWSRRRVLKAGVLVATLILPLAAAAQSCIALGLTGCSSDPSMCCGGTVETNCESNTCCTAPERDCLVVGDPGDCCQGSTTRVCCETTQGIIETICRRPDGTTAGSGNVCCSRHRCVGGLLDGQCGRDIGDPCSVSGCCTNYCSGGFCACKPLSEPCFDSSECCNTCVAGVCT